MAEPVLDITSIPSSILKFADVMGQSYNDRETRIARAEDSYSRSLGNLGQVFANAAERERRDAPLIQMKKYASETMQAIPLNFSSGFAGEAYAGYQNLMDTYKYNPAFQRVVIEDPVLYDQFKNISQVFSNDVPLSKDGSNRVNFANLLTNRGTVYAYDQAKRILPTIPSQQRSDFLSMIGLPQEVVRYDPINGVMTATPDEVYQGLHAKTLTTAHPELSFADSYSIVSMRKYGGANGLLEKADYIRDQLSVNPVAGFFAARNYQSGELNNDVALLRSAGAADKEFLDRVDPAKLYNEAIQSRVVVGGQARPISEALSMAVNDPDARRELLNLVPDDQKVFVVNEMRKLGYNINPSEVVLTQDVLNGIAPAINMNSPEGQVYNTIKSGIAPQRAIADLFNFQKNGDAYKDINPDVNGVINPSLNDNGRPVFNDKALSGLGGKVPNLNEVLDNDAVLKSAIQDVSVSPAQRGLSLGLAIARAKDKTLKDMYITTSNIGNTINSALNNLGLAMPANNVGIDSALDQIVKSGARNFEMTDPNDETKMISGVSYLEEQLDALSSDIKKLSKFNDPNAGQAVKIRDGMKNFIRNLDAKNGSVTDPYNVQAKALSQIPVMVP